jgi:aminoglycoside phosphotransferase (APT) family kinase protein
VPKPVGFRWTKEQHVESVAKMQSEVDTMCYIREMTVVPVPRVFFAEMAVDNPVGALYMFMECIRGDSGMDMPGEFKVLQKYGDKFLTAEAEMMVLDLSPTC